MDQKLIDKMFIDGRNFLKSIDYPEGYQTDQELKKKQPPLVKEKMSENQIDLPKNFKDLNLEGDLLEIVMARKSNRVYTNEKISLLELSFLLYICQGVKEIRGKSYATIRTVPCGGARHEFELYMIIRNVEGLKPGTYHYLPMSHQIELLKEYEDEELKKIIDTSLVGQTWACKSSVVFYYSFVAYRAEWRYGALTHRVVPIDLGHVGENMYLGATALKLGTCGIGSYDQKIADDLFKLDGEEEYIVYTQTLGTIREQDKQAEKDFYKFVEEQGL